MKLLGNKAAVAVWVVCVMPLLILSIFVPIEISNWGVAQLKLQRAADIALEASLVTYHDTTVPRGFNLDETKMKKAAAMLAARTVAKANSQAAEGDIVVIITDTGVSVEIRKTVPLLMNWSWTEIKSVHLRVISFGSLPPGGAT